MSTAATSPGHRDHSDHSDRTQAAREVLVLSPDDYVVADSREPVDRDGSTVQRATAARGSHAEDMGRRMRNYAFSMAIRTACVIGFVLLFPHWSAWLLVPGAVLLPYVAVILANAGRENRTPAPLAEVPTTESYRPALGGPSPR